MAEKTVKAEMPKEEENEPVVSQAQYDAVVAENKKLRAAVDKLVNAMAQRYAQDVYKEVLAD